MWATLGCCGAVCPLPLLRGWVVCGGVIFGALARRRWFWLVAWAWWLVLATPRLAFASNAGVCDERGASAIANMPPALKPLTDGEIAQPQLPAEPALCALGSSLSCNCEEGHPLAPQAGDAPFVEALIVPAPAPRARAPWVELIWAPAPAGSEPPGWPRRVEHPPRAAAFRRS